nr:MAG TPA: hypothetical protein [Caudoviricetes sp.]
MLAIRGHRFCLCEPASCPRGVLVGEGGGGYRYSMGRVYGY